MEQQRQCHSPMHQEGDGEKTSPMPHAPIVVSCCFPKTTSQVHEEARGHSDWKHIDERYLEGRRRHVLEEFPSGRGFGEMGTVTALNMLCLAVNDICRCIYIYIYNFFHDIYHLLYTHISYIIYYIFCVSYIEYIFSYYIICVSFISFLSCIYYMYI